LADILEGGATSAQIAAMCVALRMKGETPDELRGLLQTMRRFGEPVVLGSGLQVVDTCGTGGDRCRTINVSTVAALVIAGAGAPVCKHGNRAASSSCGSADVLEALGVSIDLPASGVRACVEGAGMGFCFAPRFHPALRHAGPTRRELGVPTVFNFLGPMSNPASVRRQVVGVSDPSMAPKMLAALSANGAERAMVVFGHDGLDELSTTDQSTVFELDHGEIHSWVLDPAKFGIPLVTMDALVGGDAARNAELTMRVLEGRPGPHRDIVLLNAAAGLMVAGLADDMDAGLELGAMSLDQGRAAAALEALVAISGQEAPGAA